MDESERWQGRTAVVTGAASGIGRAMAQRFAAAGMRVALADREPDALRHAAADLRDRGADVVAVETDVRDPDAVEALAATVGESFGPVHLLCNNAGVIRPGRSWETSVEDWSAVLGVNLDGVLNGLRAFVPGMLAHGDAGHIVNTSSGAGFFAAPSFAAYCVSKAAVVALSEALAAELALVPGHRLQVHVLCPGSTATDLYRAEVARRGDQPLADTGTDARWAEVAAADRSDQVDPATVVDALWSALETGDLYVLPVQAGMRDAARARLDGVGAALDRVRPLDGGPPTAPVLRDYFARVDGPTPASALELIAADLQFAFARPDGAVEGGRADLAAYLDARRPLGHRVDHHAVDGPVELAVGHSVDGETPLGAFLVAMRRDGQGRIAEYLASFHPDHRFGPS
jgi:NAD(P)-dependent dehydrogenase (short-subunit alcohol dehydrogenase family)